MSGSAWERMSRVDEDAVWGAFRDRYEFRAGVDSADWPSIREPTPSMTFDLSEVVFPQGHAMYDLVTSEALRCFAELVPEPGHMIAIDREHEILRFFPTRQPAGPDAYWSIPVYPEDDYYIFLSTDLGEGTFGHPWEQTLCVVGPRLVDTLGASLACHLPVVRRDGRAVTDPRA